MNRREARAALDNRPALPGDLPAELEGCVVEDWVGPGDRPPPSWYDTTINGVPIVKLPDELTWWLERTAHRRWRDARTEWGIAHGLEPQEVTARYGISAPRWRNQP